MSLETVLTTLESDEFAAGLRSGLIAMALGLAGALIRRNVRDGATLPTAGLLFAAAFALALAGTLGLPGGLALGLVWLGGAGMIGELRSGWAIAPVLAVPGAWLLMYRSGVLLEDRMRLLVGVTIVIGGWLLADFDTRWRGQGLGPVLIAVSAAGVYATVPDTETALVALGSALPLAMLGGLWPHASLGRSGAYAATGSLLWVVATGGVGRGSSVFGGLACLGLLVVEPLARLLDPNRRSLQELLPNARIAAAVVIVLHLGLVYLAARVAGLQPSDTAAAAIALAAIGVAVVLVTIVTRSRLPARP